MNKWQKAYLWIRGWQAPRSLKALINLAYLILKKFPNISVIAYRAFEMCKFVEGENISGLLKKGKVVDEIKKVSKAFGLELPEWVINLLVELCVGALKLLSEKT